ncbi:MAG: hypothetical protein MIO93_10485, partial [ANME-2 cluster archaeon]|nr:hypothetical protein [ANME-2 cluster archaeon]
NSGAGVTHAHHVDADTVREGAWKVMTYGATGFAYGNTGTYNSRSQPFAGIEYSVSEGADYMTYLYDFWKTTDYWKLAPFTINDVDTTVDSSYSAGSLKIGEQWTLEVDAHTGDIVTTEPKIDANDGLNGDNPYFIRNNIRWAHNYYWYSSIKDADVEPDQWVDYVPPLNELGAGTYQISTQYREGQNRGLYPCKYIINHEGGTTTVERVQYVAEIGGPVVFDLGTYDLGTDGWVRVQDTGTVSQSMGAMYFTYKGNGDVPAEDPYDGEKAEGFAVADPGNEYVVYLPSGGYITIDLSDVSGTLSVEWYNPHTGKYQGQTTVEGGAPRAFTAPDTNDWVLYLDFKR